MRTIQFIIANPCGKRYREWLPGWFWTVWFKEEVVWHALGWDPTVGWSLLNRVLGLCMSMCSGGQSLLTILLLSICLSSPSIKSSSSLSSSLSDVIVSVITSTRHLPFSWPITVNPSVFVVVMCVHPCLGCVYKVCMFLSQFVYSLQVCGSLFHYVCVFVYVFFVLFLVCKPHSF